MLNHQATSVLIATTLLRDNSITREGTYLGLTHVYRSAIEDFNTRRSKYLDYRLYKKVLTDLGTLWERYLSIRTPMGTCDTDQWNYWTLVRNSVKIRITGTFQEGSSPHCR